jgi:hypothetical protein
VLGTSVLALGAPQQPAPSRPLVFSSAASSREGTGAISGVVVDGTTGEPLAGAVVSLTGPSLPSSEPTIQVTDVKGRFIFGPLPAFDRFMISASKLGYLDGKYGRGSLAAGEAFAAYIVLSDGQWVRDLRVTLGRPAALSGTVTDERGHPIVGAYMRVVQQIPVSGRPAFAIGPLTRTDDRGVYRITPLTPGTYFVELSSEQHTVPASITSTDLTGRPADAGAALDRLVALMSPIVESDDLHRLVLGGYPIPPRSADGQLTVYPTTFFPASANLAHAVPIVVGPAEEHAGVDFQVSAVVGARISGVIDGPPESYARAMLRLVPAGSEDLGAGGESASTFIGSGGRFAFVNVPTGVYTIELGGVAARYDNPPSGGASTPTLPPAPGPNSLSSNLSGFRVAAAPEGTQLTYHLTSGSGYWIRERISVDGGDLQNLTIHARRGVTVSGRYVWEGRRQTTPSGQGEIVAEPEHGTLSLGVGSARHDPSVVDGFVIEGLIPGEYVLSESLVLTITGSRIKSILCAGHDVTYGVLDTSSGADITDCVVTFTDQSSVVTGTVRDAAGQPARDVSVIAFPVERDQWPVLGLNPPRLKAQQVTTAGGYSFQTLPAGEYYLAAVPADAMANWMDPAFLTQVAPQAARVRLSWGNTAVQNLTIRTGR